MSKIALKPNASGTGVFSLEAPNSNTDRTLTLPDEEGTVATIENIPPGYEDQDALDLFNVTGSAPVYACRAWVNFDGTGTVSIRDSGNVSSITDQATGKYQINFTTNMEDTNYCVCLGVCGNDTGRDRIINITDDGVTTSRFEIRITSTQQTLNDEDIIQASVFR